MKLLRFGSRMFYKLACVALLLVMISPIPVHAWQYGVKMSPTTTSYDAVEMPTSSTSYTTAPSGTAPSFWVGAYNSAEGFGQNGIIPYNGLTAAISIEDGSHTIASGSWGLWYTYCSTCQNNPTGTYHGDSIALSQISGWASSDNYYYSTATYPSKGEYAFRWQDSTRSASYSVTVCGISTVSGTFHSTVWGTWESGQTGTTGWGNVHASGVALWAEVVSSGNRNDGGGKVYDNGGGSPNNILSYNASANSQEIGWNQGTHRADGYTLWSSTFSATNENLPADGC